MFEYGNVEADYDTGKLKGLGINGAPSPAQENMTKCLEWAYGVVEKALADFRE